MNTFLRYPLLALLAIGGTACPAPAHDDAGADTGLDSAVDCTESGAACDVATTDTAADHGGSCNDFGAICDGGVPDTGADVASSDTGLDVTDVTVTDAPTDSASDVSSEGGLASLCTRTGGTLSTGLCCASAGDFPDSCLTGACSCAPSSSHDVMRCTCASGQCFDSTHGCH